MRRIALLLGLLVLTITVASASRRVVLAEHFTQWNCPYCPEPNANLDVILKNYWANLAVVRYHGWWPGTNNDPFYLANPSENTSRINYYGINAVPSHVVDGKKGDLTVSSSRINAALSLDSPIDLVMTVNYDSTSHTGTINWEAKAIAAVPVSNLRLRCAITESNVYAIGGTNGETIFNQAMRDMIPDANGEVLSLVNVGDSAYGSKDFTISSDWALNNCEIILWIQSDNAVGDQWRVLQAAKYSFDAKLALLSSSGSVEGKGFHQFLPGDVANIVVTVQNQGGDGVEASCTLSEDSPYLQIVNGSWNIGALSSGDTTNNSGSPFVIAIDSTIYNGHRTPLIVTLNITNSLTGFQRTTQDTIWIIVGTPSPIFYDDFSSGWSVKWTRGGTGGTVAWDTTSLQYHSAPSCATDSRNGNYANNVSRYLQMKTGIDLSRYPAVIVSWWEKYATEEGYDYCNPYYSPNGVLWQALMPKYSGSQPTWTQRKLDATPYKGNSFNLRFRFTSDAGVVDDGWYVDDVLIEVYDSTSSAVVGEGEEAATTILSSLWPNPNAGWLRIGYRLNVAQEISLKIYDIAGRLVRTLEKGPRGVGSHAIVWDGRDDQGRPVCNGIYLYQLKTGRQLLTRKFTLIR